MKMSRLVLKAVAVIALVWFVVPARAVDPNRMISQYMHERWGIERGFSGGSVASIAQTPDGYLWIGTEKGLVRFDGLSFRIMEALAPDIPEVTHVLWLQANKDGSLWVRMRRPSLVRFRDGRFENVMASFGRRESNVTATSRAADGSLL